MSMSEQPATWHFWIDRGGTFTDVVARTPFNAPLAPPIRTSLVSVMKMPPVVDCASNPLHES